MGPRTGGLAKRVLALFSVCSFLAFEVPSVAENVLFPLGALHYCQAHGTGCIARVPSSPVPNPQKHGVYAWPLLRALPVPCFLFLLSPG